MDLSIDIKVPLETPDKAERRLVIVVNPFTVAMTKELGVRVEEIGAGGDVKPLGKADLKLGSFLDLAKKAKGG